MEMQHQDVLVNVFFQEIMLKVTLPSVLIAFSLTACGGGGGSDNTTLPPTQSPGTSQTLSSVPQVIEMYGDSTIRGLQCFDCNGATVATPAPLAFEQAVPASPKQTVRNLGVDNQTACDLANNNWAGTMATSDATVVIVNHGINDSRSDVGESIADYKTCLTGIARTAKSAGKRIIFETPNPVANDTIDDYVAAMKEVANQEGLSVIDQYAKLMQDLAGGDVRTLMPDGTHPSQEIYIRKGQYAASVYVTLPL